MDLLSHSPALFPLLHDQQFGALPATPRLRYGRDVFDGILVAIDVQVGHTGRLNNIFVSSHPVIDIVTFLLRMILAKISNVNELFYHLWWYYR